MIAESQGFAGYLRRDLLLAYRRRGEVASPLIFFVLVSTLIPLGISPDSARLAELAPGIIWVMALLATLLSTETLFASDYQDGSLEQLLISPQLLALPVLGKILAHWLVTGLPLTLVSPLHQARLDAALVWLATGGPVLLPEHAEQLGVRFFLLLSSGLFHR